MDATLSTRWPVTPCCGKQRDACITAGDRRLLRVERTRHAHVGRTWQGRGQLGGLRMAGGEHDGRYCERDPCVHEGRGEGRAAARSQNRRRSALGMMERRRSVATRIVADQADQADQRGSLRNGSVCNSGGRGQRESHESGESTRSSRSANRFAPSSIYRAIPSDCCRLVREDQRRSEAIREDPRHK